MSEIKIAAVVQLIDVFSGQPIAGEKARFYFREKAKPLPGMQEGDSSPKKTAPQWVWSRCRPVSKSGGFFVFTSLPEKEPRLRISCRGFFDYELQLASPLTLPLADAITVCPLMPAPYYSYALGTTLLRGRVMTSRPKKSDSDFTGDAEQALRPLGRVAIAGSYAGAPLQEPSTYSGSRDLGAYHGGYALALPGCFENESQIGVTLTFQKAGYDKVTKNIGVVVGRTTMLGDLSIG
jgi:hypothetical protein